MEILLEDLQNADAPEGTPELQAGASIRDALTMPPPPPSGDRDGADPAEARTPEAHARELIRACEQELTANPDALRAGRLHYEIARLYESALGDARKAGAHYQEALRRLPEHVPTLRGTRRTFIVRKNLRAALPLFDAEARLVADPRRKAALHLAKGRLLEDLMGRKDEAREAYATAYELDRTNTACLKALEQACEDAGDWEALDRILEKVANAVAGDARHRAALIVARAQLVETRRQDVEGAIELYETALRLDPQVSGAVGALKRLHHKRHRHRDLIRVLELESAQATDARVRAMALYRIGRLHLDRLGNLDEALLAFERALAEAPGDALVLAELASLYEHSARWPSLVAALDGLAAAATTDEERAALLHRMGAVLERELQDPVAAIDAFEAAVRAGPDHLPSIQALGRLYAEHDRSEDLARLHAHEAEHAPEPERRAAAHVRAAEVLEHVLGQPEHAMEHHSRALAAVPGHAPAFKSLVRLLSHAGRWRELVDVYERAVEESDDQALALAHLFKVASLYEDALGDHAQAAHVYRRILEIDSHDMRAIHALQRTTERAGRWREHVKALEMECAELQAPDRTVPLLHRIGEVLHDRLGDWDGAVAHLRQALAIDRSHRATLAALGRLYHAAGRWEDLLDVYERELALATEPVQRTALLAKMAALCRERIGRDAAAIDYYRRLLAIDPGHAEAAHAVGHLLREKGDHATLAQVLDARLAVLTDPQERARTAFQLGEVYEEQLSDPLRATRVYEQALAGMPGHRAALDALARLRTAQGAWQRLADGLETDGAATADAPLAVDTLVRAGEVWADRLANPRKALECYEAARARAPNNVGILLALERLHRRLGDHRALAEVYAAQARVLREDGARTAALRELLRIQTVHHVGSDEEVQLACEALLELSPGDSIALRALEERALAAGDWNALAFVDARLAADADDPAERAAHYTRLGEALELRGEEAALDAYRMALAEEPENIAATRGLSRLAAQMNDPEALAEAARREARVSRDGRTAADLMVKSGNTRMHVLGDFEGATADFEQALELHPDHEEAADRLEEVLVLEGQFQRLVDALARGAAGAREAARRAALWKRVAELQSGPLGNPNAAISSLNRALRADPRDQHTMRELADHYARDGQWTEAVHLLQRVLQLTPDAATLGSTHLQLATLYADRMGEPERALVSLHAVLALDPTHRDALARLAELHERIGQLAQAREAAERLVAAAPSDPERAAGLVLLARIERAAGRTSTAERALRDALVLEGPGGQAAQELRSGLGVPCNWQAYVDALWRHIRQRSNPPAEAYLDIAAAQGDHLGQPEAALETLEEGLHETGGDAAVRRELASRLQAAGRHDRAVEHLQRLLARDPHSVSAWQELARVYDIAGQPRAARLAIQPLVLLGELSPDDQRLVDACPPRPGAVHDDALSHETVRRLMRLSTGEAAAADLLAHVAPSLSRLYPPDLEGYGLSARDRIGSRSEHPLRGLVDRLARALGSPPHELFVHRVRGRGVSVELGNPPILLVPASLMEAPLARRVFLIARSLLFLAQRFEAIEKLTPREIEVVLAAAARTVERDFGAGLTSEEVLSALHRRIHRALPWRSRKHARAAAGAYVDGPRIDFALFCTELRHAAVRVAAVLSDDLVASAGALRQAARDPFVGAPEESAQHPPAVAGLLRFWASEEAMALRAELGLLDGDG
jgi:cellulose synthase operon protein C